MLGRSTLVLAMVLDAVSGRHPLYRIDSFYRNNDIELLLGRSLDPAQLTDDNFGRALDHLYAANTSELYSAIVMNVLRAFEVVNDRRNRATHDRVNGATLKWHFGISDDSVFPCFLGSQNSDFRHLDFSWRRGGRGNARSP